MNITFRNPGFSHSINSIMEFENGSVSESWREPLFAFYPQVDKARLDALPAPGRRAYLTEALQAVYAAEEASLAQKIEKYNMHWQSHRAQVEAAFADAFGCDCAGQFNDITGNITLNPICPRYLDTRSFDVFYLNSERGALGMALHELVHFVWFDVWQKHFHDNPAEYEQPHMKWLFSEMAVDAVMRHDARLHEINPYFADGCAYDDFYTMTVGGKPVLDTLYEMYQSMDITAFMETGCAFCIQNENEIRTQMQ